MFYPHNLTRSNENMTIRSPIPTITAFTADTRQPWTDLQGCYSGYLIIYFNYWIISFDNLTVGYNKKNSTCSVNIISAPGNHLVTFKCFYFGQKLSENSIFRATYIRKYINLQLKPGFLQK